MKNDVAKNVMKRIVSFERRRSYSFLLGFAGVVIGFLGTSGLFLYLAAKDIVEQETLALLSLFGENFEIIKDYWKDTLTVFWEELPGSEISLGLIFLLIIVVVVFLSRRKLKIIFKRLKAIAKY